MNAPTRSSQSPLTQALLDLADTARLTAERLAPEIEKARAMVHATVERGGTLFFCGNGGSAADAQHMATEYVVRYMRNRKAYPSIALTTDTSLLTAAGNDFGFENIFSRQIEALCRPGDLLMIHSTSGNSPNVLRAAEAARERSVATFALTAKDGGALASLVDHCIIVPT
ncbi:MAG: SIS domain-containing protein, partial [Phycisphaerae bacterium]|nr:SIS domain-containing protein [Gemmatimonadaceae bacterium]